MSSPIAINSSSKINIEMKSTRRMRLYKGLFIFSFLSAIGAALVAMLSAVSYSKPLIQICCHKFAISLISADSFLKFIQHTIFRPYPSNMPDRCSFHALLSLWHLHNFSFHIHGCHCFLWSDSLSTQLASVAHHATIDRPLLSQMPGSFSLSFNICKQKMIIILQLHFAISSSGLSFTTVSSLSSTVIGISPNCTTAFFPRTSLSVPT